MRPASLIRELADAGVYLSVEGEKLLCKAAEGALTGARRRVIAERKEEIVAFLRAGRSPMATEGEPELVALSLKKAPLSPTQQPLWFLEQLTDSNARYTVPITLRLRGGLDIPGLERSLRRILERHHSLRSRVVVEDGQPYARVEEVLDWRLPVVDLAALDEDALAEAAFHDRLQRWVAAPFDLGREIPLRAELLRFDDDHHGLLLCFHHLAVDGWSMRVLLGELSALYRADLAAEPDPLPPPALQYSDYAVWQRRWLDGERLEDELEFWRRQLDGAPAVHGLPLDRPRPVEGLGRAASLRRPLPRSLQDGVANLARAHGATRFMVHEAAFAVLLGRWSGDTDLLIGTPIANRPRPELAPLIGYFANTLVFRANLEGAPSFRQVLARARQVTLAAFEHQQLPFEMLVEDLNPPRGLGLPPLLQVMFSLQEADEGDSLDLPGIHSEAILPDLTMAKFDLTLALHEAPGGLVAQWDFSRDLFDPATVERMARAYEVLLAGLVADPEAEVWRLPLLAGPDLTAVASRGTVRPLPRVGGVEELFEARALEDPRALAVIDERNSLTYAALDARANQLAGALRALGVEAEDRVGLHLGRQVEMLVAMLGCLKAGAAFVPLDPAHPADRLEGMLDDAGAKALLTAGDLAGTLAAGPRAVLHLDDPATFAGHAPNRPAGVPRGLARLAYVLYTSGSTGRPKGVMVEHGNLLNLVQDARRRFRMGDRPVASVWASFGFDASVYEIFSPLAAGGTLHLVPEEIRIDIDAFLDWLEEHRITHSFLAPFVVRGLAEQTDERLARLALRGLHVGVEPLPEDELHRLSRVIPGLHLGNCYGPTETTVYCTSYAGVRDLKRITPIGGAIDNTDIFLLDEALQPVPQGVLGEICIAGGGVARGYLNRPEETSARFVDGPDGRRIYRSGDLARLSPEGQLEFRGRRDQQVKVNGVRIEPGEIEAALLDHGGVAEAAVVVREDGDSQDRRRRLVAYAVSRREAAARPSADDLREHLARRFAAFMLPSAFVMLDRLPLTVSGKLDRGALPAPRPEDFTAAEWVPPATSTEEELAATWRDLLGLERVGATVGFFDLGGHSLLLSRLRNRLAADHGVELTIRDLFTARTLRQQAKLVEAVRAEAKVGGGSGGGGEIGALALEPRPVDAPQILSRAQQRLWFLDAASDAGAVYNIPTALRLHGDLRIAALRAALHRIVRRHHVLHTTLVAEGGQPRPRRLPAFEVAFPRIDLRALPLDLRQDAERRVVRHEAARAFDLGRDPMLRSGLVTLGDDHHVLLLTVHHIAADGWSMGPLLEELAILYEAALEGRGAVLPDLPLQYADYAHWQAAWLEGERPEAQWQYWRQQLDGLPTLHNLPLDAPRPEVQTYRGAVHRQRLAPEVHAGLRRLARRHDTTLFIVLQTAFAVLLGRWSGDTDIALGTPIANRGHEALAPLIGFFVNTLVLRTDLAGNPTFDQLLTAAQATALDAYQHQDLPFDELVDRLRPERSMAHSPLFQVMITLQSGTSSGTSSSTSSGMSRSMNRGAPRGARPGAAALPALGDLEVQDAVADSGFAKFDLTLNLSPDGDALVAVWEFARDLFQAATVERMAESFGVLLEAIVGNPGRRVWRLPLLAGVDLARVASRGQVHPLPAVGGVEELFEAWVAKDPRAMALVDERTALSYGAADARANRLARALIDRGVGLDDRVALYLERGVDMIVAMLGCLKAGAAFVPLDPAHPGPRLTAMLEDAGAKVVVTGLGPSGDLSPGDRPVLRLDVPGTLESYDPSRPDIVPGGLSRLAYVLYTSGSTGLPKGVMVEQGNLLHLVEDARQRFAADDRPVASVWASFSFDASVLEVFAPLAAGGTLHVVPNAIRADVSAWLDWLREHRITRAFLPPFFVRALAEQPRERLAGLALRRVAVGVEPLPEDSLFRIQQLVPGLRFDNGYGPTEATVYATSYGGPRDLRRNAPIGRAILNTEIRLLDDALQPVPWGVVGEIFIAGAGVARGYLGRPGETAAAFLCAPDGQRMYRSGDLARLLPDGHLEFRGRKDHQVKLHGVRIEPGEIEAVLEAHPGVRRAVVMVRSAGAGDGGTSRSEDSGRGGGGTPLLLVAYVVLEDETALPVAVLREHAAARLPSYMVPAAYVPLDEMPRTVSGKLDRRRLPAPDRDAFTASGHEAAATPLEARLVEVWCQLLGHDTVGVHGNFFDLGGNSLSAVQLMAAIRASLGRELPISALFQTPTIRGLAAALEARGEGSDERRDGDDSGSVFVELRPGGRVAGGASTAAVASPPLTVFHAAGGDVLCYQPMLRYLRPELAIHGFLRGESAEKRVPAFRTIEDLAEQYLAELTARQPEGPYRLLGWSSGGLLALEVAARLEGLGRRVASVSLVDTTLPTGDALPPELQRMGLAGLQSLSDAEACRWMREFEPDLVAAEPRDGRLDLAADEYFGYLVAANQIGLDVYRPRFRVEALVRYYGCLGNRIRLSAAERVEEMQALARQPIESRFYDATHFSILEEPVVADFARDLDADLTQDLALDVAQDLAHAVDPG